MWKTFLDTWIPLGLHSNQSKYLGWVWKHSAYNSINLLLSNTTHNLIYVASRYMQADQHNMDSFQL